MKPSAEEVVRKYSWHAATPLAKERHQLICENIVECALVLVELVPDCEELNVALTRLAEAQMWANRGIACNHDKLEG